MWRRIFTALYGSVRTFIYYEEEEDGKVCRLAVFGNCVSIFTYSFLPIHCLPSTATLRHYQCGVALHAQEAQHFAKQARAAVAGSTALQT